MAMSDNEVSAISSSLTENPAYFPDCCAGISRPLLQVLADRLPPDPALVFSIGSGSGLLEALLVHTTKGRIKICGVEVPTCTNRFLPEKRLLRVPCTASIHPDAFLASTLMFVYPRMASLIARYIESSLDGALEEVVWLGHRNDWKDVEEVLRSSFSRFELLEGSGLPSHELLVIASLPQLVAR